MNERTNNNRITLWEASVYAMFCEADKRDTVAQDDELGLLMWKGGHLIEMWIPNELLDDEMRKALSAAIGVGEEGRPPRA